MKRLILFLFFSLQTTLFSQFRDSTLITSSDCYAVKDKKIVTLRSSYDVSKPHEVLYYDGMSWKKISNDTIPTIDLSESKAVFSNYSDKIYLTGKSHLWEYDGNQWKKYSINDTLDGRRQFLEILELPDSSIILTAYSEFVRSTFGNIKYIEKVYNELLRFKNGAFTTIRSRWTESGPIFGSLKVQQNGNYSMWTTFENTQKNPELVVYSSSDSIIKLYKYPNLTSYGFNMEFVQLNGYAFDSKGSLWFSTQNKEPRQFVGLIEIRQNGDFFFYNDNIGIPRNTFWSYNFDIDDNDNIWFNYTHRYEILSDGNTNFKPSIFKLASDRVTLKEYLLEEVLQHSSWYNGGNTNEEFVHMDIIRLIKYHKGENSLLISSYLPLLQFFPDRITSVENEKPITPIHLYPNPVQSGNTITIESSSFEKVDNPLSVVIRDISGATVRENVISANGNLLSIKTEGLSRGTYYVSILNNNNLILQTSFVKE
jgi:hypothetical protein